MTKEQIPLEEQRRHPRRLYLKSVTIHVRGRTSSGMIQNMSTSGVYIEAKDSVSIGQKITISYLLSNNTDEIEIQGEVAWTDENGFAMKYI
jgi:Tfp pilus assembly protein PilZ